MPIAVTPEGIVTDSKDLHWKNVLSSIFVNLEDSFIEVKLLQFEKQESPMLVTVSGMVMDVIALAENAFSPMVVKPS